MKAKAILAWSLLLVAALGLMLIAMPAPAAFASDPPAWPSGLPWAPTTPWPTASPLTVGKPWSMSGATTDGVPRTGASPLSVAVPTPVATPIAAVQSGASPLDALDPTDTLQRLDSGGSVWYRIGTGGVHMEVWLEPEPYTGVSMAIYAPDQLNRPIGYGTPYKGDPTRLVWAGGHWRAQGNWYALITNSNPIPIRYKIRSVQTGIGNKSCYSYWEYIGPNLVYWSECR